MGEARKLRIGVIFGGRSGEHEVSLRSAESVLAALDREKYDVITIGITKQGQWLTGDPLAALQSGQTEAAAATTAVLLPPTPGAHTLVPVDPVAGAGPFDGDLDVIIPVLHGTFGEDGTVQGLLELAGLPYVGAGVVGSAVGMDKGIFKQVMAANGLPVLPWQLVRSQELGGDPAPIIDRLERALRYPMFTKPANLGSSVGVSRCQTTTELLAGLELAARYDRRIVVERGIDARELEVAVLGNDKPETSVVGEVRPKGSFYDYEAKYITDDSELLIPAPIPDPLARQVRELAAAAFMAIDCAGMGRVDFLLDRRTNELFINEINTLPGFTSISMYPKLWEATGLSYPDLLDRLIGLAVERHEVKSRLKTDFMTE